MERMRRIPGKSRRGFLLFVVIAVLMAIAIMAMSLSSFKSGAVELLGKTMDQNRLATLAQSANNEVVGMVKTQVNHLGTEPHNCFRKYFQPGGVAGAYAPLDQGSLPKTEIIYDGIEPPGTKALADAFTGLGIQLKSRAVLTVFAQRNLRGFPAYVGYLEVTSRAYYGGKYNNSVEVKERRDVKLIDVRDTFDKYALFVKNYSPDYNNPNRRLVVEGISPQIWTTEQYSRVYLGSRYYPESVEFPNQTASGAIYLDLNMKDYAPVVSRLCGTAGVPGPIPAGGRLYDPGMTPAAVNFNWINASSKPTTVNELPMMFIAQNQAFSGIFSANGYSDADFFKTHEIMKQYEYIVHSAACAAMGETNVPPAELNGKDPFRGQALINKVTAARAALGEGNTNSVVYLILKDFDDGTPGAELDNYSGCAGFRAVLKSHIDNWPYCFGYTDADSLWNYENKEKTSIPLPLWRLDSIPALKLPDGSPEGLVNRYCGLASSTDTSGADLSLWVHENAYAETSAGANKPYNLEKMFVGRMASFFGAAGNTPVFFEGKVFLRLFKVAFFEEFNINLPLYGGNFPIAPPCIPLKYECEGAKKITFLNRKIPNNLRQGQVGKILPNDDPEDYLMSRAVCSLPANLLLDVPVSVRDPDTGIAPTYKKDYDPLTSPVFPNPQQIPGPSGTKVGDRFYPPIDYTTYTHNFKTPQEFLTERVKEENGENVLQMDGRIYIAQGDLDLFKGVNGRPVKKFRGRGFLFLSKGNMTLTSLRKAGSGNGTDPDDSLRVYLQDGDFIIGGSDSPTHIDASLIALTFFTGTTRDPKELTNQGQLLMRGKSVTINGNLIVDYLALEFAGDGLPMGGTLTIIHDPEIFEPCNGEDNPYRFSIGQVRTLYSMNSGDPTLN